MRPALISALALAALVATAPAVRAAATAGPSQPPPAALSRAPGTTQPPARGPIYEVETLTAVLSPALVKQIEPLHTLQAVESLLKENYVSFSWAHLEVSASNMSPDLTSQLEALPPHEVFVLKQGAGALIGVILSKR